jgi:hypothetical protein
MNVLKNILLGGCVAALTLYAAPQAFAQGRGFDPAQFRQMRVDRAHDLMEISDTDWKAVEPLVGKVVDAQSDVMRMRMGGMGRGFRRNRGGDNNNSDTNSVRRSPFGEPDAAVSDLQKAIESKAPASELKAKLAAVRADRKDKEDKLKAAQEELKSVLTTRQEAIAVANGYLD